MQYFPQMYQPYQYNQFQNQMPQQQPPQQNTQNILSGTIIPVQNEDEARMYPIAPGNSVTFKDENQPYIYTKTMGFSQLDRPVFERYKLIKEEQPVVQPVEVKKPEYVLKTDFSDLMNKVLELQDELIALKGENKTPKRAKGDAGNAER